MKTRNCKIEAVDFYNRKGYFDINLGRFGSMEFQFEVEFTRDGNEVEDLQVYITRYDLYDHEGSYVKHGILNNRNSKLICDRARTSRVTPLKIPCLVLKTFDKFLTASTV
jgi:hypothetical protein